MNQVKGPNQVIIKQVIKLNLVMKTLPDRKNLSGELIPVIFRLPGRKNCFQNLLGNNFRSDGRSILGLQPDGDENGRKMDFGFT